MRHNCNDVEKAKNDVFNAVKDLSPQDALYILCATYAMGCMASMQTENEAAADAKRIINRVYSQIKGRMQ
jgi:hypothetical protein